MAVETKHTLLSQDTLQYLNEVSAYDATLPRESTYGTFYYGVSLRGNRQAMGSLFSFAKQLEETWQYTRTLKSVRLQPNQRSIYESEHKVRIMLKAVWVPVSHRLPVNIDGTGDRTYLKVGKVIIKPIVDVTRDDLEKIGLTDEDYINFLVDKNGEKLESPLAPCTLIDLERLHQQPYIYSEHNPSPAALFKN